MANLKNITDLPVAESAEGLNLIVEQDGAAKRVAADAVCKVKSVNGVEPDEGGNVQIDTASSWNDLKDKPFYSEMDENGNETVHKLDAKYLPEVGGNIFEDIEIFLRINDEHRIEYSGGTVPLWGADRYWYFNDEDAGAKLVEVLNDHSRFFRFIFYFDSENINYCYTYRTAVTPAFCIPWINDEYVFTKEEL